MSGKLIIVEGNIAAGKSTLVQALGKLMRAAVFIEPALDNPYLERFYADPSRYALTMQLYLLRNRFEAYVRALRIMEQGHNVILDRSIFSDYVFAKKNFVDGNISKAGFEFYMLVRRRYLADLPLPDLVLYLDVTPETCHRRIVEVRCRDCESGIPLPYLQGLDDAYQDMLEEMSEAGCQIEKIDWERFGSFAVVWEKFRPKLAHATDMPSTVSNFINSESLVRKRMEFDSSFGELHFDLDEEFVVS